MDSAICDSILRIIEEKGSNRAAAIREIQCLVKKTRERIRRKELAEYVRAKTIGHFPCK